jgi:hypothetical protein
MTNGYKLIFANVSTPYNYLLYGCKVEITQIVDVIERLSVRQSATV